MKFWLFKSEPDVFGIDHLKAMPKKTEHWDGIRNYQARNFMRDEMSIGDLGFFYHSNCSEPGVVGIVKVVKEAYPDFTSWDPSSKYFDEKSSPDNPRWLMVDLKWVADMKSPVLLADMKGEKKLEDLLILRRGNRLSITPVEKKHFSHICKLGGLKGIPA